MTMGIYRILNIITNDEYIGSSMDIKRRFRTHKRELKLNIHINSYLQRSWNKYGSENFVFDVLEETAQLKERELLWIDKCKPKFNLIKVVTRGNPDQLGFCLAEETRQKMSKAGKGRIVSEKTKKLLSENHKGISRPVSLETRKKMSESRTGQKHSKEWNKHLSEALKGRKSWAKGKSFSMSHRMAISKALTGKKYPDSSERQRGRIITPEWREKIRISLTGRKHVKEWEYECT